MNCKFPLPCTNVPEMGNEKMQIQKIAGELDEVIEAWEYERTLGCETPPVDRAVASAHTDEEIADVITACVTLLNMRGVDAHGRAWLYRQVNEKNMRRGYL